MKKFYGWGTDNKGWMQKQAGIAQREVNGEKQVLVSKVDAQGWAYCEWVKAYEE
jgi:hypothetical protein